MGVHNKLFPKKEEKNIQKKTPAVLSVVNLNFLDTASGGVAMSDWMKREINWKINEIDYYFEKCKFDFIIEFSTVAGLIPLTFYK